ncbi:hypothetical protein BY996DRAFT_6584802 [Phakopsora pachyrhizi]|nr:hypothetical protein BY996DRAFT_6584802 [Phakopsora pachyrhizi]
MRTKDNPKTFQSHAKSSSQEKFKQKQQSSQHETLSNATECEQKGHVGKTFTIDVIEYVEILANARKDKLIGFWNLRNDDSNQWKYKIHSISSCRTGLFYLPVDETKPLETGRLLMRVGWYLGEKEEKKKNQEKERKKDSYQPKDHWHKQEYKFEDDWSNIKLSMEQPLGAYGGHGPGHLKDGCDEGGTAPAGQQQKTKDDSSKMKLSMGHLKLEIFSI